MFTFPNQGIIEMIEKKMIGKGYPPINEICEPIFERQEVGYLTEEVSIGRENFSDVGESLL